MRQLANRTLRLLRRRAQIDEYLRTQEVPKLHLGAGEHVRSGWLNTDLHDYGRPRDLVYLDARRRFPFPEESFALVYSEHMLEHLTFDEGQRCLHECRRVLRPGGRIRIATPSLGKLARLYDDDLTEVQRRYIRWAVDAFVPDAGAYLPGFVLNNFVRAWGHRFIYDADTLGHALERAGFADVRWCAVGESSEPALAGLERHLANEPELNEYETIVLEAQRR